MTGYVRVGGRGGLADGSVVTWSVAEGRRGRRWREVRVADDAVISSLLLETDRDGHFSHTELSTAAGLLTLHPEGDGTIHGNTVGANGIGHVVGLPWDRDGLLLVKGSAIAAVAGIDRLRARIAEGMTVELAAIVVGLDLTLTAGSVRVARSGAGAWQIADGPSVVVDERGLPVLAEGSDWPLE